MYCVGDEQHICVYSLCMVAMVKEFGLWFNKFNVICLNSQKERDLLFQSLRPALPAAYLKVFFKGQMTSLKGELY